MLGLVRKIIGTSNDRELRSIKPLVQKINQLETTVEKMTDADLAAQTIKFRERLSQGETLDSLLPEAFATVREASKRVLGMRHYDVQLIGGITLHRGRIAEMKTGEGKTLVSTLPAYLNALEGKGVHIVTVNDYLARRDSAWMGQIHRFLGMSVGVIVHGLTDQERKANYACDITYGMNSELGFDYLRDNMKFSLDTYVQREHNFAIVDEVDSIFIDEARTPLIISGPTDDTTDKYYTIDKVVRRLDFSRHATIDEKNRNLQLTEEGVEELERLLGIGNLYNPEQMSTLHHVMQAVKAHALFKLDVHYVVRDGEVMIVDEFTGRIMPGRRWSDGLHQAIEAKEGVKIANENQTLASITYQNFFRMYKKLGGMTGTADTEAAEFKKIYNLDVTIIPTNRNNVRIDHADVIYKTEKRKFQAVVDQVKDLYQKGQPVLIGTISVENSEKLSRALSMANITHDVLNAKNHSREADIVAQAGRLKAVTIATNMAGRGTDILLGGNPEFLARTMANPDLDPEGYDQAFAKFKTQCAEEHRQVKELGGLFVIGTERHESRRIDNQLRGRCARQGDPGESKFYLCLEDNLLRIFGGDRITKFVKMEEDETIEHSFVNRAIESAQKRVEAHNFDIRKHLLDYDNVVNQQRKLIYSIRREVLEGGDNTKSILMEMVHDLSSACLEATPLSNDINSWNFDEINEVIRSTFVTLPSLGRDEIVTGGLPSLHSWIKQKATEYYETKESRLSPTIMRQLERMILLQTIDMLWKDHLLSLDHLREGIGLRGYGQKDPLVEYKKEAFSLFQQMNKNLTFMSVQKLMTVEIQRIEESSDHEEQNVDQHRAPTPALAPPPMPGASFSQGPDFSKAKRNDPCPCGSGKKFKKCHGS